MAGRLALAVLGCMLACSAAAGAPPPSAHEVFARVAAQVGQVRILEHGSQSKAAIGSGFFAAPDALVTNFHVVAPLVRHPGRYSAELVHDGGDSVPLALRDVDVVNDLAVLRPERTNGSALAFAAAPPPKGTRLYSLGNPYDLGSSIVEGTYNGLVESSLPERMHFTGAINAGMSGGPAIAADGRVVGVNVAGAENEIGFLVPARFAASLVREATAAGYTPPERFLDLVRDQLRAHQEAFARRLLTGPIAPVTLGPYRLPGRLGGFMTCWGDTEPADAEPAYEHVWHACASSQEGIFLGEETSTGTVELAHHFFRSGQLNRFQLAALRQSWFVQMPEADDDAGERTAFRCQTDFVDHGAASWKIVFCLRGYPHLAGLYDLLVKAASVDRDDAGVDTMLAVNGVSFENATRVARRYVEAVAWTR